MRTETIKVAMQIPATNLTNAIFNQSLNNTYLYEAAEKIALELIKYNLLKVEYIQLQQNHLDPFYRPDRQNEISMVVALQVVIP